jgi:nitroimidazol reductase NimA-like FMN-containing flavoprotein (pyridoxamine 5'-phosphate oxidase superfamily)
MKYPTSDLNKVKRGAQKASYDKEVVHQLLDLSPICNIAFTVNDLAMVQPINFGRVDDKLYIHGSHKNRMTSALLEAKKVCLTSMILDSMKLSKSAFHHSVNYRSVVVFGKVRELSTDEEKLKGLEAIINHFVPNRWENCRFPNEKEMKATRVLEIEIESASAKIANAPTSDNKTDEDLDYWAGQIPIKTICEFPIPKDENQPELPEHIQTFYEQRKSGF